MSTIHVISMKSWDAKEWDGKRPSEVAVRIKCEDGSSVYAWSPDGYGAYYYDTLAEVRDNHE